MRIRSKKHVLLIVACAFALVGAFALFGCGGTASNTSADTSGDNSTDTAATTESTTESTTANSTDEATTTEPAELQIFAANSLEVALNEVQKLYTEEHPEITFADTQYLSSGDLVTNLKEGAPADILITASKGSMDDAEENGDIDTSTRFDMFTNELIIVAGKDSDIDSATLEDIASGDYSLALGGEGVPAGNYARQALTTTDPQCWISDDGKIGAECSGESNTGHFGAPLEGELDGLPKYVEGSSVGNTAQYVADGQYMLGLVYSSDLYRYDGMKQVGTTPADSHKNIVYPAAVCTDAKDKTAAEDFLDWAYTNEDAIKIWQQYGFELA